MASLQEESVQSKSDHTFSALVCADELRLCIRAQFRPNLYYQVVREYTEQLRINMRPDN